jgi:hypothetical protein
MDGTPAFTLLLFSFFSSPQNVKYFIASGVVEVMTSKVVRAKLMPGLFFGEISLLFGRMKRTASIRTVTPCILYSLSKSDLDAMLLHHPTMAARIRAVAEERLEQLKALKRAERESMRLREALEKVGGVSGPSLPGEGPTKGIHPGWASGYPNGGGGGGGVGNKKSVKDGNNGNGGGSMPFLGSSTNQNPLPSLATPPPPIPVKKLTKEELEKQAEAAALVAREVQRSLAMVKSTGYAGGGGVVGNGGNIIKLDHAVGSMGLDELLEAEDIGNGAAATIFDEIELVAGPPTPLPGTPQAPHTMIHPEQHATFTVGAGLLPSHIPVSSAHMSSPVIPQHQIAPVTPNVTGGPTQPMISVVSAGFGGSSAIPSSHIPQTAEANSVIASAMYSSHAGSPATPNSSSTGGGFPSEQK